MKPGSALAKAGLFAFGYFFAVCAAVVVTEAIMVAPMALPDEGASGSIVALVPDFPGMFVVGLFWTFICALPGFIVAIIIGERRGWSRWTSYALAGTANVVPSLAIFAGLAGAPFTMPSMVVGAFPGGFAGGAAYWFAAGRMVAGRRKRASA
jgi:hypothetical protein